MRPNGEHFETAAAAADAAAVIPGGIDVAAAAVPDHWAFRHPSRLGALKSKVANLLDIQSLFAPVDWDHSHCVYREICHFFVSRGHGHVVALVEDSSSSSSAHHVGIAALVMIVSVGPLVAEVRLPGARLLFASVAILLLMKIFQKAWPAV